MTKEEFKLKTLSSACTTMQTICDSLICFPELRDKALALREEIQKEYETVYAGQESKTSFCLQTLNLNSVIDYLEANLQNDRRIWCFCPTVSYEVTCNPEDIKKMLDELKSDFESYSKHLVILDKGHEGPRFYKEIPKNDYDKTICFLEANNSTNFITIQYY